MIILDAENKDNKKQNFILSDMVKRKILDMYNISKDKSASETVEEKSEPTEESAE